jgi:hypothetical protein
MTTISSPPKQYLVVLFYCFDFKKSNSALPNSILYTLGLTLFVIAFPKKAIQLFQIHAIGHSLGGHLVGHFGRAIERSVGQGKIARVTGK